MRIFERLRAVLHRLRYGSRREELHREYEAAIGRLKDAHARRNTQAIHHAEEAVKRANKALMRMETGCRKVGA